ncbi:MAG: GNAT family N-acetyltransferase [Bacteroidales bacterium]|nr:GNAT family N-acetyltransferase [Bacteroidales bacterium]
MDIQQFDFQPILQNDIVRLQPLKPDDFETLYSIASDPLLWEQHPNKDRYKREVFTTFFQGAIESGGAYVVFDAVTGKPIGSSRFYDFDADKKSVSIGYTFIARDHWGTTYNHPLKAVMLDHAFNYVEAVIFHIGSVNIRSQKSIERLDAVKIEEREMEYFGEVKNLNFIYRILKSDWIGQSKLRF